MSKTLLLSAGSTETSGNKKAAQYAMRYLQDRKIKTYLFDNLYTDIPFILEGGLVQPDKIIEIRNALIECQQIVIFSPVFNGGYASHLKNTLDWVFMYLMNINIILPIYPMIYNTSHILELLQCLHFTVWSTGELWFKSF